MFICMKTWACWQWSLHPYQEFIVYLHLSLTFLFICNVHSTPNRT
jgi:hypothetical protein